MLAPTWTIENSGASLICSYGSEVSGWPCGGTPFKANKGVAGIAAVDSRLCSAALSIQFRLLATLRHLRPRAAQLPPTSNTLPPPPLTAVAAAAAQRPPSRQLPLMPAPLLMLPLLLLLLVGPICCNATSAPAARHRIAMESQALNYSAFSELAAPTKEQREQQRLLAKGTNQATPRSLAERPTNKLLDFQSSGKVGAEIATKLANTASPLPAAGPEAGAQALDAASKDALPRNGLKRVSQRDTTTTSLSGMNDMLARRLRSLLANYDRRLASQSSSLLAGRGANLDDGESQMGEVASAEQLAAEPAYLLASASADETNELDTLRQQQQQQQLEDSTQLITCSPDYDDAAYEQLSTDATLDSSRPFDLGEQALESSTFSSTSQNSLVINGNSGFRQQQQLGPGCLPVPNRTIEVITKVITPILFTIIIIVGLVGNIVVMLVILEDRKTDRELTPPNLLILDLSFADLSFIIFCIPFTAWDYSVGHWVFGSLWCKLNQYLIVVCALSSIYTLVLMSLDRFMAVVYPIQCLPYRTSRNTLYAIYIKWAVILIIASPVIKMHGLLDLPPGPNQHTCRFLEDQYNPLHFQIIFFVTSYLFPLILIFCLYLSLLNKLWFGSKPHGHKESLKTLESKKKVTWLVAGIVIVFAICWCPIQVMLILMRLKIHKITVTYIAIQVFAHTLGYMNSCTNPIVYAFASETFNNSFKRSSLGRFCRTCCPCLRGFGSELDRTTQSSNTFRGNYSTTHASHSVCIPSERADHRPTAGSARSLYRASDGGLFADPNALHLLNNGQAKLQQSAMHKTLSFRTTDNEKRGRHQLQPNSPFSINTTQHNLDDTNSLNSAEPTRSQASPRDENVGSNGDESNWLSCAHSKQKNQDHDNHDLTTPDDIHSDERQSGNTPITSSPTSNQPTKQQLVAQVTHSSSQVSHHLKPDYKQQ